MKPSTERPIVGELVTPALSAAIASILDTRFPVVSRPVLANDPRLATGREVARLKALGVTSCGGCGGSLNDADRVYPVHGRLLHNGGTDAPDCRDEFDAFTDSPFGGAS